MCVIRSLMCIRYSVFGIVHRYRNRVLLKHQAMHYQFAGIGFGKESERERERNRYVTKAKMETHTGAQFQIRRK